MQNFSLMKTFVEPANLQEQYVRTYEIYNPHRKNELKGWLLIESFTEENKYKGLLLFRLSYIYLSRDKQSNAGDFQAYYNKDSNEVSLTNRDVFLKAERGIRIGSLLMSCVIEWARQWPNAAVIPIGLSDIDATNNMSENKNRRNRFYEQFGIKFEYKDANKTSGRSKNMFVSDLVDNKTIFKEHGGSIKKIEDFPYYFESKMSSLDREIQEKVFLQNKLKKIESRHLFRVLNFFNLL
ncbi:hypothetical protein ACF1CY_002577 [Providencia rettgeri]